MEKLVSVSGVSSILARTRECEYKFPFAYLRWNLGGDYFWVSFDDSGHELTISPAISSTRRLSAVAYALY